MESWKNEIGQNKKMDSGLYRNEKLNSFYLRNLDGVPRIKEMLIDLETELREKGRVTIDQLDSEIEICMALFRDIVEDYGLLTEGAVDYERRKKALRLQANESLKILGKLKEQNNLIMNGPKNTIPIGQVRHFLQCLMQIILYNVKDPAVLKRIAGQISELSGASLSGKVNTSV